MSSTLVPPSPDPDYVQLLGEAIRRERLKRGFTQEGFARYIEIDRGYMGGVERGQHNLTFGKLMRVMDGLGVDPFDFFREIRLPGLGPAKPHSKHGKQQTLPSSGTPAQRLGAALRLERAQAGFTQEDFAFQLGLGRAYLSGIETGARNPTFTQVLRILRGLDLQPAAFFSKHFSPDPPRRRT